MRTAWLQAPDAADSQRASELKDRLADAIAALPKREKLIIGLSYAHNPALQELASVREPAGRPLHTPPIVDVPVTPRRRCVSGSSACGTTQATRSACLPAGLDGKQ